MLRRGVLTVRMQLRSSKKRGFSAAAGGTGIHKDDAVEETIALTLTAPSKPRKKAPKLTGNELLPREPIPDDGTKVLYRYETLLPATLVRRYKRFLADVVFLTGDSSQADAEREEVTVHCPNTGPMVGLLDEPNARVQLSKSADPKRKYAHTLEMIQISNGERDVWVGLHSSMANKMVEKALHARWFPELGSYDTVRREVKFAKNSRVDFILSTTGPDGEVLHEKYVEVKSVTLATGADKDKPSRCAVFPDTVSTRAQKHVTELTELVQASAKKAAKVVSGAIVFLVQRDDCHEFAPSIVHDPKFAELCAHAAENGIQLLAYACALEPDESACTGQVRLLHALPLQPRAAADGDDEDPHKS